MTDIQHKKVIILQILEILKKHNRSSGLQVPRSRIMGKIALTVIKDCEGFFSYILVTMLTMAALYVIILIKENLYYFGRFRNSGERLVC